MAIRSHHARGFTLVELLVVIGIIALLISMLLPSLHKARDSANSVKCQANLRSIGQALVNYTTSNKMWIPQSFGPDNYANQNDCFDDLLSKYMPGQAQDKSGVARAGEGVWKCPTAFKPITEPSEITYASNRAAFIFNWDGNQRLKKITQLKRTQEIIAVGDVNQAFPNGGAWVYYNITDADHWPVTPNPNRKITYAMPVGGNDDTDWGATGVRYRHFERIHNKSGAANFVFFDGHCESIRIDELRERNVAVNY